MLERQYRGYDRRSNHRLYGVSYQPNNWQHQHQSPPLPNERRIRWLIYHDLFRSSKQIMAQLCKSPHYAIRFTRIV
jgi:hypothetical protein